MHEFTFACCRKTDRDKQSWREIKREKDGQNLDKTLQVDECLNSKKDDRLFQRTIDSFGRGPNREIVDPDRYRVSTLV